MYNPTGMVKDYAVHNPQGTYVTAEGHTADMIPLLSGIPREREVVVRGCSTGFHGKDQQGVSPESSFPGFPHDQHDTDHAKDKSGRHRDGGKLRCRDYRVDNRDIIEDNPVRTVWRQGLKGKDG